VKIAVIIPARNEEEKIASCLQSILANGYPKDFYEIIVVDDHSTDSTVEIVSRFPVKIIRLSDHISTKINSYKKKAIECAISNTDAEIVICTDADTICTPHWIQTIVSFMKQNNSVFVSMPVRYNNGNSALALFQELDFMTLQGITGAAVYNQMHSMSNGANLAYLRSAYLEVGGFDGIQEIASGDDMLLMEKMAKHFPGRLHYIKSKKLIVRTDPMLTLKTFLQQRVRWASKSVYYPDVKIKAVLLLVFTFNGLLLSIPFLCIFYNPIIQVSSFSCSLFCGWGIVLILKSLVEWYFLFPVAQFFGRENLGFSFFIAQPFHILYTVIAGFPRRNKAYEWKGRNVN